jgi:hypothetical protein
MDLDLRGDAARLEVPLQIANGCCSLIAGAFEGEKVEI